MSFILNPSAAAAGLNRRLGLVRLTISVPIPPIGERPMLTHLAKFIAIARQSRFAIEFEVEAMTPAVLYQWFSGAS